MNTKHTKNRLWMLVAILFLTLNAQGWAESLESIKRKEVNQSFNVGTDDLLDVDNRYGNITITHWNKNEVSIQVVIESKASSDSRAQEGLDRVQIDLNKRGNTVYAKTSLRSQSGSNNNNRITIAYYISMPSKLSANISQKYGNINMPEINEGKYKLEVKYGNIKAGSFTSPLIVDGGYSNIDLDDVQDINLNLAYCGGVNLKNSKVVRMDSKYSNVNMGNAQELRMDKKYGNLKMNTVDVASIDVKYSEVTIERVKEEISAGTLSYGTLNIRELAPSFKKARVDARYGNLNISISSKASFKVAAVSMKYGNVDVDGFNITQSNVENKTDHYFQINGGGSNTINFDGNSYSNLRIKAL